MFFLLKYFTVYYFIFIVSLFTLTIVWWRDTETVEDTTTTSTYDDIFAIIRHTTKYEDITETKHYFTKQ